MLQVCQSKLCQLRHHVICTLLPDLHIRLNDFDDELELDPEEVFEIRWANINDVQQHAAEHPEAYTQWFCHEMQRMNWLQGTFTYMSC